MTAEETIERSIRAPVVLAMVSASIIGHLLIDDIASREFSQATGYGKFEPYGIFALYYPQVMNLIRWAVPLASIIAVVWLLGPLFMPLLRLLWITSAYVLVVSVCIGLGVFMVYALYSVTHHMVGG